VNRRCGTSSIVAVALLTALILAVALAGSVALASAAPAQAPAPDASWSFAVMADTQWTNPPGDVDHMNPNTVAVDIINQLNRQFIGKQVKFVIQTGDLTDKQSTASIDTSAIFRQALYNAHIGFYPLRGNHESSAASAAEVTRVFPQTQSATMNATPADAYAVANTDQATQPSPVKSGDPFRVGAIATAPVPVPLGFGGLCYAVDFKNARLVFLDQFTPLTNASHSVLDDGQVAWMNSELTSRPAGTHAFVFGHKGIITDSHVDTLFGANPSVNPALQNTFIDGLAAAGVRYYMGGHDHMHNRALVRSPDGTSSVEDITMASNSSKFYIPNDPSNDAVYNGGTRETEVSQELNTVGYYLYTVDGPRVTVDYYSAIVNPMYVPLEGEYQIASAPIMGFAKRESFGYSLNGKQFLVPKGQTYTSVQDSFQGTGAAIIDGSNGSTATDSIGRSFTKTVDTGWTQDAKRDAVSSNILTLWGMEDLGKETTDTYVLSMSYGPRPGLGEHGGPGTLVECDASGAWVKAVSVNAGGRPQFVNGPYSARYALGTYGVDQKTRTAWAVLDHDGTFAVGSHIDR
jgi:hypothetical protein